MRIAMLMMIALGTVIGLALPTAMRSPAPAAATPAAAAATPTPAPPRETVIRREGDGHFYAFANVNSEPIRFVVDTGASTVALTPEDARRAHINFDPSQVVRVGFSAGGELSGQPVMIDRMELDGKRAGSVPAVVLPNLTVSLLGQSYLRQIATVSISNDEMRLK